MPLFIPFDPDEGLENEIDAKGDLLVGIGADDADNLPVGADGEVLIADSSEPTGVRWGIGELATQAELDAHLADATDAHAASAISFSDPDFAADDVEDAIVELNDEVIKKAVIDAKGDLIVGAGNDIPDRLPVGEDGLFLAADSTEPLGVKWAAGGGGGGGTSDHGALVGLGDDDHPQYHNEERGDLRYWQLSTDLATQAELDAVEATIPTTASDVPIVDAAGDFDATDVEGALAELQADAEADAAALAAHLADATDAHDASAISILDAAGDFTADNVEDALAELQADAEADATALADHLADATDAHDASAISIADAGAYYTGTDVEAALQEIGAGGIGGGGGGVGDKLALYVFTR